MKKWTEGEINQAIMLRLKGYTIADIAVNLGRSKASVRMQSARKGKPPGVFTDAERLNWLLTNLGGPIEGRTILDAYITTGAPPPRLINPSDKASK